jgi:hypothetical protein
MQQTQLTADQLLVNEDALTCSVNLKPYVHIKTFTWDLSRQKHSLIAATGPMHNGTDFFVKKVKFFKLREISTLLSPFYK